MHYAVSTNLGLLQSNMSWLYQKHGNTYHWIVELFRRLRLPIFDGMVEALQSATEVRAKNLSKKKTVNAKERCTKTRAQEQQERKLWSRRQRIEHTYGSDDDDCSSEKDGSPSTRVQRKCKRGSVDHRSIRQTAVRLTESDVTPKARWIMLMVITRKRLWTAALVRMDRCVHVALKGLAIIVIVH